MIRHVDPTGHPPAYAPATTWPSHQPGVFLARWLPLASRAPSLSRTTSVRANRNLGSVARIVLRVRGRPPEGLLRRGALIGPQAWEHEGSRRLPAEWPPFAIRRLAVNRLSTCLLGS